MSEFRQVYGFEDRWRSTPIRPRPAGSVLSPEAWKRVNRIINRTPEAVVRVTAGINSQRGLARHLDYISRKGELALHAPEGQTVLGRDAVREVADDWSWIAGVDSRASPASPIARAMVLSYPTGPDPARVEAAASTFAEKTFAEAFEYLYVRHDDGAHPHVHLTVRALGRNGERLTPRLADLHGWRDGFAEALRENEVEAEATIRRVRGIVSPAERAAVFRIRQRNERGLGPVSRAAEKLDREAREFHPQPEFEAQGLEGRIRRDREVVKAGYAQLIDQLRKSREPDDRSLAGRLEDFVAEMPSPVSRRERVRQARDAREVLNLIHREREERSRDRDYDRSR